MATKRDLVEAHAFSRRRLVTAFVSGAPGGREVEPARPARVLVGGAALAVLLIAGAAIAGVFTKKTPDDWAQPGLFVSKETGAAYVITDDERPIVVRPVINITSAKLILGADIAPTIIAQSALEEETIGGDIGILGAPASPPDASRLVESGWTACTGTGTGIRLDVSADPPVRAADGAGSVVRQGKDFYLMAQAGRSDSGEPSAYRYLLPRDGAARDNMLNALGLRTGAYATEVSETYLGLFPTGGDLAVDTLGLDDLGSPAPYATPGSNLPGGARVGDVVAYDGGTLLLGPDYPIDLDEFARAIYTNLPDPPRVTSVDGAVDVERGASTYADAHWPTGPLAPLLGEQCAQLDAVADSPPRVQLVADPTDDASAAGVPPDVSSVRVDAGRGAIVLSGDWSDDSDGSPVLTDAKGLAYPLVGVDAADLLGYGGVDAPVVPDTWVQLFRAGAPLSQDAALCPPRAPGGGAEASCE
jgi:Type VII secretion system ESX-1, transport TM domain B